MATNKIRNNAEMSNVADALRSRRVNPTTALVQTKNKSGKWGKAFEVKVRSSETVDEVIERMTELNPGKEYRIAE